MSGNEVEGVGKQALCRNVILGGVGPALTCDFCNLGFYMGLPGAGTLCITVPVVLGSYTLDLGLLNFKSCKPQTLNPYEP